MPPVRQRPLQLPRPLPRLPQPGKSWKTVSTSSPPLQSPIAVRDPRSMLACLRVLHDSFMFIRMRLRARLRDVAAATARVASCYPIHGATWCGCGRWVSPTTPCRWVEGEGADGFALMQSLASHL